MDRGTNPLAESDPRVWEELIESTGPASLLVLIRSRMGEHLRGRLEPEDILQEALVHAWRDRANCEWQGVRAFRRWLIRIIENRLNDAADREGAAKRGGALPPAAADAPLPIGSTTPSRIAMHQEEAAAMHAALAALAEEVREVVRLRLIDELPMEEVAQRLGLGLSAAKHRLRKGVEDYERRIRVAVRTRSGRGA